jgi:hypothetical protein
MNTECIESVIIIRANAFVLRAIAPKDYRTSKSMLCVLRCAEKIHRKYLMNSFGLFSHVIN